MVIGVGLWLIGIPSASLWGILAAVLRFVPYIGAAIAAAFPLALAVAVDPSWTMLLWTIALFIVVEPIVGHVIEPMVYGHSTGLSPVAVRLSLQAFLGTRQLYQAIERQTLSPQEDLIP
jgi:predicted PurR-regulated permease PerM